MDTQEKIKRYLKNIGDNVRKLRSDSGLSLKDFCKKNNLKTVGSVSMVENGKNLPSIEAILNICLANNISADTILFGDASQGIKDHKEELQSIKEIVDRVFDRLEQYINNETSALIESQQAIMAELDELKQNKELLPEKGLPEVMKDYGKLDLWQTKMENQQNKLLRLREIARKFIEDKKTMQDFINTYL